MKIKKEYIPFSIGLGIVCLNIPIVLLLYFLKPNLVELFARAVVPCECVMMGICIIYSGLKRTKVKTKNCKVCEGVIKKFEFILYDDSDWKKMALVSYVVNGKTYETYSDFGINGILTFFLKGKKIKVYYKEDNPEITYIKDYITLIVGSVFIIVGIYIAICY